MQELDFINTWLGGHQITIEGIRALAKDKKTISVCEIGCGGGDNLRAVYRWAKKNKVQVEITGIDIKESCIEYAKATMCGNQGCIIGYAPITSMLFYPSNPTSFSHLCFVIILMTSLW